MFTNKQKRDCVRRELKYRERVYPRLVDEGKMSRALATEQLAIMGEIAEDYLQAMAAEEPKLFGREG